MSDENEDYDAETEEQDDAAYDSDYCYESDGIVDEEDESAPSQSCSHVPVVVERQSNSFQVVMDPKAPTTEEWRAIYSQLRNLIVKSNRRVNYEWDFASQENFRTAILYIQSFKETSCFYPFRINFHATKELSFPEVPPQIQPLFSLPAPLFVMIIKHPLLTARHWNPCQELTITLEFIVSMLDNQLNGIENILLSNPVGGGNLGTIVRSAEEANKWLADPISRLTIEQLVSFLYGYYLFEIPYSLQLLDSFLKGEHILAACPLTVKKELPKHSGTGYSKDTSYGSGRKDTANTSQQSQSAIEKVLNILKRKFDYFLQCYNDLTANCLKQTSTEFTNPEEIPINWDGIDVSSPLLHRFANWIIDCPLLFILHRNIQAMASGDIVRESNNTLINFDLTLQLELICHKLGIPIDSEKETLFMENYRKLFVWNKLDLFSDELQSTWITSLTSQSTYWKEIERNEATAAESGFKGVSPSYSSSSSGVVSDSSALSDSNPCKLMKIERNQVIYVSGLEKHHHHYKTSSPEKCNKYFMKELKTLNESLPQEILIFVSEDHPNYVMALFYIVNQDSPYYGGMYLFHITIPETYPAISPKVIFMTTGYGTVR
jgi:hypothetical protein